LKVQELQEILLKKEEVIKYCEEEKGKARLWIDEQKQAIEKERKVQAKLSREARAKNNQPPIRYMNSDNFRTTHF
jgi:hypothetical protein